MSSSSVLSSQTSTPIGAPLRLMPAYQQDGSHRYYQNGSQSPVDDAPDRRSFTPSEKDRIDIVSRSMSFVHGLSDEDARIVTKVKEALSTKGNISHNPSISTLKEIYSKKEGDEALTKRYDRIWKEIFVNREEFGVVAKNRLIRIFRKKESLDLQGSPMEGGRARDVKIPEIEGVEGLGDSEIIGAFVDGFNASESSKGKRKQYINRAYRVIADIVETTYYYKEDTGKMFFDTRTVALARDELLTMFDCQNLNVKERAIRNIILLNELMVVPESELEKKTDSGLEVMVEELFKRSKGLYENVEIKRKTEVGKDTILRITSPRLAWPLVRALTTTIKTQVLLEKAGNRFRIEEGVRQERIKVLDRILESNKVIKHEEITEDGEVKFWAEFGKELLELMGPKVSGKERLKDLAVEAVKDGVEVASSVASAAGNVAAHDPLAVAEDAFKVVQTVGKAALKTAGAVKEHSDKTKEWANNLIKLEKVCFESLNNSEEFRLSAVKLVQQYMHGEETNTSLSYGVLTILERVVLDSTDDNIREEGMKLIFRYSNIGGDEIRIRVVIAALTILFNVKDKPDDGGSSDRIRNTAYAIVCYCQHSEDFPDQAKERIRSALDTENFVDSVKAKVVASVKARIRSAMREALCMNVIRFVMRWVADIKSEGEYGGSSLATLLSYSRKTVVVPPLLAWLKELFPKHYRKPDVYGNTPYHVVAMQDNPKMIRCIAEELKAININQKDYAQGKDKGYAALHYAVEKGFYKTVEELINIGETINPKIKIDICDKEGNTPFHIAVREAIKTDKLLAKASDEERGAKEKTATAEQELKTLLATRKNKSDNIEGISKKREKIEELREEEEKKEDRVKELKEKQAQHKKIEALLVQKCPKSINCINKAGDTALNIAIREDAAEKALEIKALGGEVAEKERSKTSAISVAARCDSTKTLVALISKKLEGVKGDGRGAVLSKFEAIDIVEVFNRAIRAEETVDDALIIFHLNNTKKCNPYKISFRYSQCYTSSDFFSDFVGSRKAKDPSLEKYQTVADAITTESQGKKADSYLEIAITLKQAYSTKVENIDVLKSFVGREGWERPNKYDVGPLHMAVLGKKHVGIELLAKKYSGKESISIDAKTKKGFTALHLAALLHDKQAIKILLDEGADPNVKNEYGDTPFQMIFGVEEQTTDYLQIMVHETFPFVLPKPEEHFKDFAGVAKLFIDKDANVGLKKGYDHNLLHRVALSGSKKMVEFVCERYKNKDKDLFWDKNHKGRIPIEEALEAKKNKIVEKLIRTKAHDGLRFEDAEDALDAFFIVEALEALEALKAGSAEAVERLIKKIFNSDSQTKEVLEALKALKAGNAELVKKLIETKAHDGLKTIFHDDDTRLEEALEAFGTGNAEAVKKLIKTKAHDRFKLEDALKFLETGNADVVEKLIKTIFNSDSRLEDALEAFNIGNAETLESLVRVKFYDDLKATFHGDPRLEEALESFKAGNAETLESLVRAKFHDDLRNFAKALQKKTRMSLGNILARANLTDLFREYYEAYSSMVFDKEDTPLGLTPLHVAAREGNTEIIEFYKGNKLSLNHTDKYGNTACIQAVLAGNIDFLEKLIEAGADINITNKDGRSALHIAAAKGSTKAIEHLVGKRSGEELYKVVRKKDVYGNTALQMASTYGKVESAKVLLEKDPELFFIHNDERRYPIHTASVQGHEKLFEHFVSDDLISLLQKVREGIELSSIIDYKDVEGNTPFLLAALKGSPPIVKLCKESDASIIVTDNKNENAAHKALYYRHRDVVKYLAKIAAESILGGVNCLFGALDDDGEPPVHELAKMGDSDEAVKIFRILIDLGVDPWVEDRQGRTLLDKMCVYGCSKELWKSMIATKGWWWIKSHGHRIIKLSAKRDSKKETCLHIAAASGQFDIVKFFIKDPETESSQSQVSRNVNAFFDRFRVLWLGGILAVKNKDGMTPLHCAVKKREYVIAEYMIEQRKYLIKQCDDKKRNIVHMILDKESLDEKDLKFLAKVLKKDPSMLEDTDEDGRTPLYALADNLRDIRAIKIVLLNVPGDSREEQEKVVGKKADDKRSAKSIGKTKEDAFHKWIVKSPELLKEGREGAGLTEDRLKDILRIDAEDEVATDDSSSPPSSSASSASDLTPRVFAEPEDPKAEAGPEIVCSEPEP